eukprot:jgi/Ulvmu1/12746/UM095_0051.1
MAAPSSAQDNMTSKDYYFDSYSHFGIHEEMLKDTVRTRTYQAAIMRNEHMFSGAVVLDVGCGTGILSMMAAKAGAKKVYAIDMSSIATQAKQIVEDNGLSDTVEVMHCKMEDAVLPEPVDIIVSEWMGFCLLYESMLPSVLHARDKWLKPGGAILPDRAEIFVACIEDEEYKHEKIEFWQNVYGFNMSAIKKLALQEPLVDTVGQDCLNSRPATLLSLEINSATKEDLVFDAPFELVVTRNDHVHALVLWFDIWFDCSHKPISMTTSPAAKSTHWKQTVFYLEDSLTVCKDEVVKGHLKCVPNVNNPRDLDFELRYEFNGKLSTSSATLQYRMR